MVNHEYESKIRSWLERSGYDLELRVARAALLGGASVLQSVLYRDVEEKKAREADVVASFQLEVEPWSPVAITVVAECKRGTGQTWIAFGEPNTRLSNSPILDHTLVTTTRIADRYSREIGKRWLGWPPFDKETPIARTLVSADLGGDRRENGLNIAGDAVRQTLSAARGVQAGTWEQPQFAIPVLVTGASLFYCELTTTQNEIDLRPVDYARIRVPSLARSEAAVLVHAMSPARFEQFIPGLAETLTFIDSPFD